MFALKSDKALSCAPELSDRRVIAKVGGECYLLEDGQTARCAASCLLRPEQGDRVLVSELGSERFVLHVLERQAAKAPRVRVPGADEFCIEQASVSLLAQRQLALACLNDVEITAAQGKVMLTARNLFITVADSVVENARHRIAQVQQYLLQVRDLWRVHSRQGLLTSEQDLKVDAERVSVG